MIDRERLLRSMRCIEAWADAAIEHKAPIGNNLQAALYAIRTEARAAIAEGESK
jgi:hypothetical protein